MRGRKPHRLVSRLRLFSIPPVWLTPYKITCYGYFSLFQARRLGFLARKKTIMKNARSARSDVRIIIKEKIAFMTPMPGTIYYKTKYGATEDYARWLSEEVGFDLENIKEKPEVRTEGIVVIGSSLMIGKVRAAAWILRNWDKMKDRKPVFFCVGSSKIGSKEREEILARSLPKDVLDGMTVFHLPGRIDHKRLGFFTSGMMKRFAKYEKDEVEKRRAIEGYDDVKRENLAPVVAYIKTL